MGLLMAQLAATSAYKRSRAHWPIWLLLGSGPAIRFPSKLSNNVPILHNRLRQSRVGHMARGIVIRAAITGSHRDPLPLKAQVTHWLLFLLL